MDVQTAVDLVALAEGLAPRLTGPDADASLAVLEERYDELVSAVDVLVEADRSDDALRLVHAMYRYWITQSRFDDGARVFGRALADGHGDPALRGRALLDAGFMPFWTGDDERAKALFEEALAVGRALDDAALTSGALGGLSRVALRGDVEEGRRLAHEALEVSDAAGDEMGRSNALHLLGVGAQIAGDLPEARSWMVERLALVRRQRNDFLTASESANLSMVERQLGDLHAAESLARDALEICQRIGDRFMPPFLFSGLAAIALEREDDARAATLIGAAEAHLAAANMAWPPDERPHYELTLSVLTERLDPGDLRRWRERGAAMSWQDAIDYARQAGSASADARTVRADVPDDDPSAAR
jgi:tetratricopeptide (TPR) repeat protein